MWGRVPRQRKQPRKPRRSTEGVSRGEENTLTPKANRVHRGTCPSSGLRSLYSHHFSKADPTWLDRGPRVRLHGEAHMPWPRHWARTVAGPRAWCAGHLTPGGPCLVLEPGEMAVCVDHESWDRRCPGGFAEGHPYQGGVVASQVACR